MASSRAVRTCAPPLTRHLVGAHGAAITALAPMPDGTLVSGCQDGDLRLWRARPDVLVATPGRLIPPYIRRTDDNRLLVSVSEIVSRNRRVLGVVLLTREAREVDDSVLAVRLSILALFALALGLTVLLSWYLSLTIARPILRLATAAEGMREGRGRAGTVQEGLLARTDEVGELARALSESARALWARMDAIEQFAADVRARRFPGEAETYFGKS